MEVNTMTAYAITSGYSNPIAVFHYPMHLMTYLLGRAGAWGSWKVTPSEDAHHWVLSYRNDAGAVWRCLRLPADSIPECDAELELTRAWVEDLMGGSETPLLLPREQLQKAPITRSVILKFVRTAAPKPRDDLYFKTAAECMQMLHERANTRYTITDRGIPELGSHSIPRRYELSVAPLGGELTPVCSVVSDTPTLAIEALALKWLTMQEYHLAGRHWTDEREYISIT